MVQKVGRVCVVGERGTGLVWSRSVSVDPCLGYDVLGEVDKVDQLGFGRMGRSGRGRTSALLFPRTGVKG